MKRAIHTGLGWLVAATLFATPAMGQQAAEEEEEETGSTLQDMEDAADLVQDPAEKVWKGRQERPSLQGRGTSGAGTSQVGGVADDSAQGLEALMPVEDDAAKAALQPVPSLRGTGNAAALGDDALHAVPVNAASYTDDVARGAGLGAASFADDAARLAGGGLAKIGGALAVLGALLAKLFGVGKKDE